MADAADNGVFQTGPWILPDDRPLSSELDRFLDGGDPRSTSASAVHGRRKRLVRRYSMPLGLWAAERSYRKGGSVVIPNQYDQHYWAQRVHTLGIGIAHAAGAPTRDSLAGALARTLRPEMLRGREPWRAQCVGTAPRLLPRDWLQSEQRLVPRIHRIVLHPAR